MSFAYRCEVCHEDPAWTIDRVGDVIVSWACDHHLAWVCRNLQRNLLPTQLTVRVYVKREAT